MNVLSVSGLGKSYIQYRSEIQRLLSWFGLPVRPIHKTEVLSDISFKLAAGEALGIVGSNGAGKSTLLKVITGTLKPSEGQVEINGRVAAILELGMGFNPELTGRQNVRLAAGLMGFSSLHIDSAMSDIETFAEIGGYFDKPMRTYSSGMQVRVAFSVATAWRPEILIVDEALSVGDSYFQHKSFSRIREFRELGTALLIVSHDRNAIQSLCNRAILLEKGSVTKDGDPEVVFDLYNALIAQKENTVVEVKEVGQTKPQTISGTKEATIIDAKLQNSDGEAVEHIAVGENFTLTADVVVNQPIDSLVLGYAIKDRLGQVIYGTNTWHTNAIIRKANSGELYQFAFNLPANLGVGSYSVSFALHDRDTHLTKNYDWHDRILIFNVFNHNKDFFQGSVWLPQVTQVTKVESR